MLRYHLTSNGPKECHATKKPCPLGGEHYTTMEKATAAYLKTNNLKDLPSNIRNSLPKTDVTVFLKGFAGNSYLGAEIDRNVVQPYLDVWINFVGSENADFLSGNKANRDRGYFYHLTVITPPEMRKMRIDFKDIPQGSKLTLNGIGKVEEPENESWFIVCSSPELNNWRAKQGLPEKDFHITLGFSKKDIHNQFKGKDKIILE